MGVSNGVKKKRHHGIAKIGAYVNAQNPYDEVVESIKQGAQGERKNSPKRKKEYPQAFCAREPGKTLVSSRPTIVLHCALRCERWVWTELKEYRSQSVARICTPTCITQSAFFAMRPVVSKTRRLAVSFWQITKSHQHVICAVHELWTVAGTRCAVAEPIPHTKSALLFKIENASERELLLRRIKCTASNLSCDYDTSAPSGTRGFKFACTQRESWEHLNTTKYLIDVSWKYFFLLLATYVQSCWSLLCA